MEDQDNVVLLIGPIDELSADLLIDLLQYEKIPAMKQVCGAGSIYDSGRLMGADVYVSRDDLERAMEITADFFTATEEAYEELSFYGYNDDD